MRTSYCEDRSGGDARIHASFVRTIVFLLMPFPCCFMILRGIHALLALFPFVFPSYLTSPTIPYFIRDAPNMFRLSASSWRVSLMRYLTTYTPHAYLLLCLIDILSARTPHVRVSLCFTVVRIPFIYSTTYQVTVPYTSCIFHTFYASSVDPLHPRCDLHDILMTRPGY